MSNRMLMPFEDELREYEDRIDHSIERAMALATRCPIHGNSYVAGVGIQGVGSFYYKGGVCPECWWEYWDAGLIPQSEAR